MMKFRRVLAATTLAAGIAFGPGAPAALINGDFSAGFTGWEGLVVTCGFCDGTDDTFIPVDPVPGAFPANFTLDAGDALLVTDELLFDPAAPDVWSVTLSQTFSFDPLSAPGASLELSYDLVAALTSPGDSVLAALEDLSGVLAPLDLAAGIAQPIDITAWAGRNARITFSVEDFTDGLSDTLRVGAIQVVEAQAIPAPPTVLLLGLGLLTLAAGAQRAGKRRA